MAGDDATQEDDGARRPPQGGDDPLTAGARRRLRRALALTRGGLAAERAARAFWPLWTILVAALAMLLMGLHVALPLEAVWTLVVLALVGAGGALAWGAMRFRFPTAAEAALRLDGALPGRPLTALSDAPAIGGADAEGRAMWAAHRAAMARRLEAARAVPGDLRLAARDPYGLRYVALIALAVGLLFGQAARLGEMPVPGAPAGAVAEGPSWEGWIRPPAHTGLPVLYLADQPPGTLELVEGSEVAIRLYGDPGALTVDETISTETEPAPASAPERSITVARSGRLAIFGPGGAEWRVVTIPDATPVVLSAGPMERGSGGRTEMPFAVEDDHGIAQGTATIAVDMGALDRRYALAAEPEPREPLLVDLPLPITGDRAAFEEVMIADLAEHPFAGLPVTVRVVAEDAAGQASTPYEVAGTLPGRRFFDPLARAVVEQRQAVLWSRENAGRASQILRAVSHRPEDGFDAETTYLRLRMALRTLERHARVGLTAEKRDEVAALLWQVAVEIEEGRLADALERLREAQERLADAMENGATDEEIAELMQELREAMDDYMRQLAENAEPGEAPPPGEGQEITQDQLQQMMDRIQELMEQGRMEEARELMEQLNRMMENMQVTQGPPGQGGEGQGGEGQQAMEGLNETLREQQGLSDEAFRDLQEREGTGREGGQSAENEGSQGGQGRGERHDGQGEGRQGEGSEPGQRQAEGGGPGGSLADRQGALRRELERQQGALPGRGTPGGDAAAEALDRAGEAMDRAEDALRDGDAGGALGAQADAMEALREGMRQLADEMRQAQEQQSPGGAEGTAEADGAFEGDPLGRAAGAQGQIGGDDPLAEGDDVYRRAQDLVEELRRRAGERARPEAERRYLERLLEPF